MTRLSRFAAVVVLLGGSTAVLSSCSGDPGPIVTESPSPTAVVSSPPSPSPTPTVTAEEELLAQIPEDARAENFVSASNFAKFFVLEYQRMFDEKDSALFSLLSEPDCMFCASSLESYADLIGEGGTREGGVVTVPGALAQGGLRDDGYWYAGFVVSATLNNDYDSAGNLVETEVGGDSDIAVKLLWRDDYWHVAGVNVEPSVGG